MVFASVVPAMGATDMISEGKQVKFHYTLTVEGQVADTSDGKDPLMYVHGQQAIIPGLEAELEGMKVGDKKTVIVASENAYGPIDPQAVVELPRENMDEAEKDVEPQVGMVIQLQSPDGQNLAGIVEEVKEEVLVVNFNHPLAGKELSFDVEIIEIADAPEAPAAPEAPVVQ